MIHQAPLSVEFSKQEYWSGLPFPISEDLSDPGIKPLSFASPELASRFFFTLGSLTTKNYLVLNLSSAEIQKLCYGYKKGTGERVNLASFAFGGELSLKKALLGE